MEINTINQSIHNLFGNEKSSELPTVKGPEISSAWIANPYSDSKIDLYDMDIDIITSDDPRNPLSNERTCTSPSHQRSYCACTGGCHTNVGCR